jgi:uncharacterized membrane protein YcaP (DUF421 family)
MSLGLSWWEAASVVISTIGIYLTFVVLLRLVGQRALANMSSFDLAAVTALGAVMGRVILGYTPTLLAGVIGLLTLFGLQAVFGVVRRYPRADAALTSVPLLLMANGEILEHNLRRARIVEDELRPMLRLAGIRRYEDVGSVILEHTGAISVLHRGDTISEELLADVHGREALLRPDGHPPPQQAR